MAEDPEVIREQMEHTRASLSEKIEALEQHVVETVHEATGAVAETVGTIKEAAQETVGTVKETVQETVNSVRETFDLRLQFQRRPWFMLGGSLVGGYLLGSLFERRVPHRAAEGPGAFSFVQNENRALAKAERERVQAVAAQTNGVSEANGVSNEGGLRRRLTAALEPELDKLKGIAIGGLLGVVRDFVAESVKGELGEDLRGIIDDFTQRLGGRTFQHPLFPTEEEESTRRYQRPPARAEGMSRF